VKYVGRVGPASVPTVMASHDVLLMPSRFEGLPYTLIEAMAGGCVPVATQLRGVTDFVVRHGETGFLFPMGDVATAAACIRRVHGDVALFEKMSRCGREDVFRRFSIPALAEGYAGVIARVEDGAFQPECRHGTRFELLQTGSRLRRMVPNGLKNVWRKHFLR
jgi:glycosyltransferase involved in cell wall biosynthesis